MLAAVRECLSSAALSAIVMVLQRTLRGPVDTRRDDPTFAHTRSAGPPPELIVRFACLGTSQ